MNAEFLGFKLDKNWTDNLPETIITICGKSAMLEDFHVAVFQTNFVLLRPLPAPTPPGFILGLRSSRLTLCSAQTKLISGNQPPFVFKSPDRGGYIIFPVANPTAQWVVHRSITRSVHPWPCLQPQRSRPCPVLVAPTHTACWMQAALW